MTTCSDTRRDCGAVCVVYTCGVCKVVSRFLFAAPVPILLERLTEAKDYAKITPAGDINEPEHDVPSEKADENFGGK